MVMATVMVRDIWGGVMANLIGWGIVLMDRNLSHRTGFRDRLDIRFDSRQPGWCGVRSWGRLETVRDKGSEELAVAEGDPSTAINSH